MTQIAVRIADIAAGAGALTLVTIGLGSCVAIALYARAEQVGALAHVLLPNVSRTAVPQAAGKCPTTAVPEMMRRMRELGARGAIEARVIGGASMFAPLLAPGAQSLGARNVIAVHAACEAAQVPVVAQDVGGHHGRSVYFDVSDGTVLVRSLRQGDVLL